MSMSFKVVTRSTQFDCRMCELGLDGLLDIQLKVCSVIVHCGASNSSSSTQHQCPRHMAAPTQAEQIAAHTAQYASSKTPIKDDVVQLAACWVRDRHVLAFCAVLVVLLFPQACRGYH